jgi:hypothetical protein
VLSWNVVWLKEAFSSPGGPRSFLMSSGFWLLRLCASTLLLYESVMRNLFSRVVQSWQGVQSRVGRQLLTYVKINKKARISVASTIFLSYMLDGDRITAIEISI